MRTLGVDYGDQRIGLAVSDPLGITAQALPTLQQKSAEQVLDEMATICSENNVSLCVVGLPINMNGSLGKRAEIVLKWVDALKEKLDCDVKTWDERLTSREAQRLMIHQNLSRKKQKEKSDQLAAVLILQNYLEFDRSQGKTQG